MISQQTNETIRDMSRVLARIELEAEEAVSAPVLSDIRAMRRDLDRLEREMLEIVEHVSDGGDAC
jgi:hypothetical protein